MIDMTALSHYGVLRSTLLGFMVNWQRFTEILAKLVESCSEVKLGLHEGLPGRGWGPVLRQLIRLPQ